MKWKCPECSASNEDTAKACKCGYAFYKILGVKPDASAERVKQTYQYLLDVWQPATPSKDPIAKKKADERLKKINDAYNIFKSCSPNTAGVEKKTNLTKIVLFSSIVILLFVAVFVVLNIFKKESEQEQTTAQVSPPPPTATQPEVKNVPALRPQAPLPQTATTEQPPLFPDLPSEKTEEWAIEAVKKSHALDPIFPVETIMNKWTLDNAGKFKVIGWQSKKMDDQTYLVSFTSTDGLSTSGFYFDVNIETNAIRNIANHPELQEKYKVLYR